MDVVLVNPASRAQVYQGLGESLAAIQPPMWIGYLATFLRKKGYSVAVVDAEAYNLPPEISAEQILEFNPTLVAVVCYGNQVSASTQVMPGARAICVALKESSPETKTLLVGGHVAALPQRTLEDEPADFVCGGEGPYTVADLVDALRGGRIEDLKKVRGLWYKLDGGVHSTAPAPLITDLDNEMPQMAWDLLPVEKYRAHNWHAFGFSDREPYGSIYTTLGCPYHCSFCCIQAPFKSGELALNMKSFVNSYRFYSPESVIAQIDDLVNNYGVRHIRFADELFVLNERHVNGICDLIISRGYDLNIWAYSRVDSIKPRIIEKMKKAGINWVCLGIESASSRVREDIQKDFEQDLVFKICDEIWQGGISILSNFIFGLPEDDLDSMKETLELAIDLNAEFANFYSAMAYPGSQLYTDAVKNGALLPSDWSGYSQHSVDTLPLPTNYLSGPEVLKFRDEAFQTYFTNPKYLEMVNRKYGESVVREIREMSSIQLVRNYTNT